MYVTHVKLENWRNFRKVDVDVEGITYLIGPNGAGKSNFLDVFRFLRDIAKSQGGGLQQAIAMRGGMSKVRCLAARRNPEILIEVQLAESLNQEPKWQYTLKIAQETNGNHSVYVSQEQVVLLTENKTILSRPKPEEINDKRRLSQTALENVDVNEHFREIADFFEGVLYLHLVPQLLKYGNELAVKKMTDDPFGQGFLETIAKTSKKTRDSRLKRIGNLLKEAIHGLEDLQYETDKVGQPHLKMRYVHWRPQGGWQTEEEFSDGTLRLIALLWSLLSSNSMILLEEPELSLHNAIISEIPEIIQRAKASRKKTGGQIFVSTHSQAILSSNCIDGQYLILETSENGEGTKITTPSEEDNRAMKAGMTASDILLPRTGKDIQIQGKF